MTSAAFMLRQLAPADAEELAHMLRRQRDSYIRHFIPFSFEKTDLLSRLSSARQDAYFGVFWGERLVAFFMLRGWDDGFDIPAYGVAVDEDWRGRGLAPLTLSAAMSVCRLRGVQALMLKVHPENAAARSVYERAGFTRIGVDPKNGNLVYNYQFL